MDIHELKLPSFPPLRFTKLHPKYFTSHSPLAQWNPTPQVHRDPWHELCNHQNHRLQTESYGDQQKKSISPEWALLVCCSSSQPWFTVHFVKVYFLTNLSSQVGEEVKQNLINYLSEGLKLKISVCNLLNMSQLIHILIPSFELLFQWAACWSQLTWTVFMEWLSSRSLFITHPEMIINRCYYKEFLVILKTENVALHNGRYGKLLNKINAP